MKLKLFKKNAAYCGRVCRDNYMKPVLGSAYCKRCPAHKGIIYFFKWGLVKCDVP